MKVTQRNDHSASLLTLSGAENCDTDSWPIVTQVFFRHYLGAYDAEYAAIAAAIVFARHCGSVAEFVGAKIGIDAARAIRAIVPEIEDVLPIDGMKREIGKGTASVVVCQAGQMFDGGARRGHIGKAARAIAWSGDFVTAADRNSTRYIGGDVFTNALLVAGSTSVSVAIALLVAGRSLGDIFVPAPPKDETKEFDRLARGLDVISIKLAVIPSAFAASK